ncbi:HlyD family secretion protein [Desulfolutivibrio sulfoxidireducens]|uniref:HlyD family secretion protein n=1 Tax=Desulfolutivibrio sulfoxidireducens TaxID=2773299 RepID=UPI00159E2DC5|nr:HlyD family secretion protein [Desulfolutivibrio sulfoxidireducens]QLA15424.1 biotin/lipoyl-binding protein [Desulfolutivibrio sulfoxidireducens]QLA19022.1 biotin/lipoyl-binding protein [Desulfolutivibrio sulfoxidireducens]
MTTTPDDGATREEKSASPKKKRILIGVLVVLIAGALGYYLSGRGKITTDDAFVDGRIHYVTPRVPGYVARLAVTDNQVVAAGDVLVELDPTDYQVALAQARADLASAESQLAAMELEAPLELTQTSSRVTGATAQRDALLKSLEQARKEEEAALQDTAEAQARFDQAKLDLGRYQSLHEREVVSQSDMDKATTAQHTAQAQTRASAARAEAAARRRLSVEADLDRLAAEIRLAQTGKDTARIKDVEARAQRARVDLAREKVRQAELNLGYTRIVSPVAGNVTKKAVEQGRLVAAGQPLLAVVPLDPEETWITANYKETQLTNVRPGQEVVFTVDAYPGRKFRGRVESIMAGTGAVFSLFPPENASGNYVKVVQRIPVKIVPEGLDADAPVLRLGMSVVPTILVR